CSASGGNEPSPTTSETPTTTEDPRPDPDPDPIDLHRLAPEASMLGPAWTLHGWELDDEEGAPGFFNAQRRAHCPDLLDHIEGDTDAVEEERIHAVYRSGPRWTVMEIGPYPSEMLDQITPYIADANRCEFEFDHDWIDYSIRYEGVEDIGVGDWSYVVSLEMVATYPHGTETGEPYGPVTAWARTAAIGVGELAVVINLEDGVDPETGEVHGTDEEELLRWAAGMAESLERAQETSSG